MAKDETGFQLVDPPDGGPEPMTFATLVISLSTGAMVHLGAQPDEADEAGPVDLDLARQSIDILAMLREKTRGNLDESEAQLLDAVLHDLRMRFVAVRDARDPR